jgi:hypothetical protein
MTISARASDTPMTPFSTERAQARTLAAQLGGEAKDYSQLDAGWLYDSDGTTGVEYTVPKGALVDNRRGVRGEGQSAVATKYFVWWP